VEVAVEAAVEAAVVVAEHVVLAPPCHPGKSCTALSKARHMPN